MSMKKMMKKIIIIALVVLLGAAGLMLLKGRFSGMQLFSSKVSDGTDLMIVNDSSDTISVEYKDGDQKVAQTLPAGEKISGGKGFIQVFTAKKSGSYELTYPFPRPAGSTQQISLSQIVDAAKKEGMTDEVYTQKGMIGDVAVVYEEARELQSTY